MKKLLVTLALGALVGIPLAAQAQERDGYQGDSREAPARTATAHGYDASARTYDRTYRRAGAVSNRAYDRGQVAGGRNYDGYRANGDRYRGGVSVGYGHRGYYPYAGYYPDAGGYRADGYGADYAYSYPDGYGTYQPFAYDYSAGDDAYDAAAPADGAYSAGGPAYGDAYDAGAPAYGYEPDDAAGPAYGGADSGYQAAPNAGWSRGAGEDCGQWVWREARGAYQWVAASCSYPQ